MFHRSLAAAPLLATLAVLPAQEPKTPAEATDFQKGPTMYEPLMQFVYDLESRSDLMSVQKITETLRGRDVLLCMLSNPPVRRPADAANTGKPIVLIVNNVHGGEVAGKDASLILMRDLVLGELKPLLDEVIVLVVPTINPDGAEARRRTNEQGFDMNRDYIKQESQEISALVTQVINPWQPHLHVDTHHGGAAPYTLVYQTCMNPAGDPELVRFGNERVLPRVREALRAEDYDGFWYSGPRRRDDGWEWRPTSVEPRKQHVYAALSNIVGFLFETPSCSHRIVDNGTKVVPIEGEERYRHQVRGEYLGLRAMIRFAASDRDALMQLVADAKQRATRLGGDVADGDQIVLAYEQVENLEDQFWVRDRGTGDGGDSPEYRLVTGAVMTKFVPTKTTTRPWGYLLEPQLAKVVPLLLDHEIAVETTLEEIEIEVDSLYATSVSARGYFQGHYLKKVETTHQTETKTFPAGSFFVPMAQPKSNLIGYLLEPETDDSLATWNYLDDFVTVQRQRPGNTTEASTPPEEPAGERTALESEAPAGAEQGGEESQEGRSRWARRGRTAGPGQRIPIHRVMKETPIKGTLVEAFDTPARRRYFRK